MHSLTTLARLLRTTRTFPTTGKLNYMNGPGSRSQQNKMFGRMPGMTVASLKKHYDLIPIVMIIGLAIVYPAVYTARLALRATCNVDEGERTLRDVGCKRIQIVQSKRMV